MKQRLLLALLVLFASVGTTWGQSLRADEGDEETTVTAPSPNGSVTLTIPKGKTVTITVSGNVTAGDNTYDAEISSSGSFANKFTLKAGSSVSESATSYTAKFVGGYYTSLSIGVGPTAIVFGDNTNTTSLSRVY